jgi:hypothetical protein
MFSVLAGQEPGSINTGRKSDHCHQLDLVQAVKGEHSNRDSAKKQLFHVAPDTVVRTDLDSFPSRSVRNS